MTRCGCNPILLPFEFTITENQLKNNYNNIPELFLIENDIQGLKDKIIYEYLSIIDNLECGIQPDLEFLLEEISLVEIKENG